MRLILYSLPGSEMAYLLYYAAKSIALFFVAEESSTWRTSLGSEVKEAYNKGTEITGPSRVDLAIVTEAGVVFVQPTDRTRDGQVELAFTEFMVL